MLRPNRIQSTAVWPDQIPAAPLATQSLADPFAGPPAPGKAAQGTYVFSVKDGSPTQVQIEVTVGGGQPLIVFVGTRP